MDEIRINRLEVYAHHGVLETEQKNGQCFYVDAVLRLSLRKAGLSDNLALTVNYADVCQEITDFMQTHTYQLIETVAEQLTTALLQAHEEIQEAVIMIHKPNAPIPLPFEDVSVCITRKRHKAFIALGSNMGDSREYLRKAVEELAGIPGNRILKQSKWMVTKPYGGVKQDDFLNGMVKLETLLMPQELLAELNRIESLCGRVRELHWGPRTLDLDIIFYDDCIVDEENLVIPHCDMHNRDFVLEPMVQIEAWHRHPLLGKTMSELLKDLRRDNNQIG